uniref:Uncharacterized protein n=1 Tax=Oryza rufipogon TaxID=4529 RepID=A0A0E0NEL9_ORYRU
MARSAFPSTTGRHRDARRSLPHPGGPPRRASAPAICAPWDIVNEIQKMFADYCKLIWLHKIIASP